MKVFTDFRLLPKNLIRQILLHKKDPLVRLLNRFREISNFGLKDMALSFNKRAVFSRKRLDLELHARGNFPRTIHRKSKISDQKFDFSSAVDVTGDERVVYATRNIEILYFTVKCVCCLNDIRRY